MIWQMRGFSVSLPSIACNQDIESEQTTTSCSTGSMCQQKSSARVMAVASAAKMVLLSGSLLDSWRQVASPF